MASPIPPVPPVTIATRGRGTRSGDREHLHFSLAGQHSLLILVHDSLLELEQALAIVLFQYRARYGEPVPQAHGKQELEVLWNPERARARELRPDHRRDERSAEHPMSHDVLEARFAGELRVDVKRIVVTGHLDEPLDVLLGNGLDQLLAVTDANGVEVGEHSHTLVARSQRQTLAP